MSKEKGTFFRKLVVSTFLLALTLFVYVFTLQEIKTLNKNREKKLELLKSKQSAIEQRKIEIQKLSAEDRIVKIASDSLGLVRSLKPFDVINVDRRKIEQIKRILEDKYE
ncbi:MAG: hypothetical protein K9J16_06880 [Melioribacteraceae bacterium]|nr:hypothetical protein [Melioribacteraceae bacterium]MCF8354517.1 hypothetical protein [Melioribacteraceae bacterium]MCF8394286.1 hypothetical protein [Melioribacteraceae bacterium]MCF8418186.1 hypothetical protein [Melioribacteraceae bacterium]